jgi:hypothetical protein
LNLPRWVLPSSLLCCQKCSMREKDQSIGEPGMLKLSGNMVHIGG